MKSRRIALASLVLLGSASALAAGRPRYGGELRVAHAGPPEIGEPALADTPLEATLLGLLSRPVCAVTPEGEARPTLARELSRPTPQSARVMLPNAATAGALARAWMRLSSTEGASPYRALLYPLRGEGRQVNASGASLELALSFPWPDLERALCHPALAAPVASSTPGPFSSAGRGTLDAQLGWPRGRPYLDRLLLTSTDERGLARLWSTRQAQLELGVASETDNASGALLYATYLAFSPRRVPADFRQAVESSIDREDLTRLFVRGPAVPMPHLLPPALMQQGPKPRPAAPASGPARTVTLVYDAALEDQRAVAERIQVKLHERGYTVALEPLTRSALRARWAKGDFELMLHALLLPPVPGPALAVVLDAGGRKDLLGVELPAIGALSDAAARDARVRERALALAASLPLLPLYAQGLGLRVVPEVGGLVMDAQGLPMLDGAFILPPEGAGTGGRP
ncbi:peptide ABC transporter substrate-binding protein [Myxococcus sp. CA051A]|uniref:peptide ABC transporter substrate-binding protein n=1 Tax=unclassified Myxococcus TaxID=2648731 RepID=UPI00157AF3F9|nr:MULTISPECIES: peptide ABC transporter substrate-binding protein [unclassified Myxococcus]NTX12194.1 peptide ABC transporter substrate-binding protein [Myxococcus sp. CA056]NTX59726.1 peptide ABC transporter substrate-binding protein [Myxococcus sp. CA051A]